ncbi:MAG: cysteine desulfurase family protein [Patescibacteria group bacterium]
MRKSKEIYLDYASGTEPNPSAIHELGVGEKKKLEVARECIARVFRARASEIIFTSGGTESNNLAILGMPRGHVVTTNIEHASVLEAAKQRGKVTFVPVEKNGIVDPRKIRDALRGDTVLVSVMYANNEIGTIQPIREIAKEIRHWNKNHSKKIYFHTDAVQAVNYLPINVEKLGVDLMSLNAAKIYGPKGVGALYVRQGTPLHPIMFGGNQEGKLRPGTENVAGAEALAEALEETERIKEREIKRLTKLRDYFLHQLARFDFVVNGDLEARLPNNVNVSVTKIPSDLLVIELSARGIMVSGKSACKSGDEKASHVLRAIRGRVAESEGSLRFSLGRGTTKKDIERTVQVLAQIFAKLEKWYH